ncbi:hypothetical protein Purlil1_10979 [Purpureocillium lilacinum]|uniref:Uncharacterized protein n=1 Tax=Purpureocillium lilacinum TaxID=33203 RepID=A0ABR0BL46_PURLI|nr:hypothetical protein Purlil1_10979 [Purpureocillium lilacinum]
MQGIVSPEALPAATDLPWPGPELIWATSLAAASVLPQRLRSDWLGASRLLFYTISASGGIWHGLLHTTTLARMQQGSPALARRRGCLSAGPAAGPAATAADAVSSTVPVVASRRIECATNVSAGDSSSRRRLPWPTGGVCDHGRRRVRARAQSAQRSGRMDHGWTRSMSNGRQGGPTTVLGLAA